MRDRQSGEISGKPNDEALNRTDRGGSSPPRISIAAAPVTSSTHSADAAPWPALILVLRHKTNALMTPGGDSDTAIGMKSVAAADQTIDSVVDVVLPDRQRLPVVLASPHSGRVYPESFVAASRLDPIALRRSEDSFVDEIFTPAVKLGIPMVRALFPRAFVDTNREPFELDPDMFDDVLPGYVNTRSPRVAAGLGTIARVVAQGQDIYQRKLRFDDALDRVQNYYQPYHDRLRAAIDQTHRQFGSCLLIDCHSMPSIGVEVRERGRSGAPDFVLGDCFGSACAPIISDNAERWLSLQGYRVVRNTPYAGGYTTRHYGKPRTGVHALQIEINRGLYMQEESFTRKPYLSRLAEEMAHLVQLLATTPQVARAAE